MKETNPRAVSDRRNALSCSGEWMRLVGGTKVWPRGTLGAAAPAATAPALPPSGAGSRGTACGMAASTGRPVSAGPLAAAQGARVSSPRLTAGSGAPGAPPPAACRAHGAAVGGMAAPPAVCRAQGAAVGGIGKLAACCAVPAAGCRAHGAAVVSIGATVAAAAGGEGAAAAAAAPACAGSPTSTRAQGALVGSMANRTACLGQGEEARV